MTDPKLPRELQRAFARRKSSDRHFNLRVLADEAGVPHGWVRSVFAGQIARPPAAKLRKLAEPLGLPVDRLLALTDQLGAATEPAPAAVDQAAVLAFMERQTVAAERQADAAEDAVREQRKMNELLTGILTAPYRQLLGDAVRDEYLARPDVQRILASLPSPTGGPQPPDDPEPAQPGGAPHLGRRRTP